MNEHPILFKAEMVRAILGGSKTQTRRVIKPQPLVMDSGIWYPSSIPGDKRNKTGLHYANEKHMRRGMPFDFCPYGLPLEHLWVRETFAFERWDDEPATPKDGRPIHHHAGDHTEFDEPYWLYPHYRATDPTPELCYEDGDGYSVGDGDPQCKWLPSIHMPRWASRILLEIDNVRVERVQVISNADMGAEGSSAYNELLKEYYIKLWDSINAKRGFGWDVNPWVWVIEFRKLEPR